ncbi:phosphoethanolamine transferase [Chitinimonas prasina]|uniref:Phosphoethanolamine transferase n=1 Tax=Chitinimonas prasina TaxID=1434937 RepID=A0ABQ5YEG4_9NEIS|nr:phosphoethanolamine--lipid A transferase [Chitinimonas prasina]GLR12378.1 phosphoethanolamine transferase [Chitinimonas prasina]
MHLSFTHPYLHLAEKHPWLAFRPVLRVETLTFLFCAYFALMCNGAFWRDALAGRPALAPDTWLFALSVAVGIAAVHAFVLLVVLNRWTVKPLLAVLMVTTGMATYFSQRYQVYFDTSMIRNVMRTDVREASDLLTPDLLLHLLLLSGLPLGLLWRVDILSQPLFRAAWQRLCWMIGAALIAVAAILLVFQDFSALMRNQKALRHLIAPGNFIVSTVKVLAAESARPEGPKTSVGVDAKTGRSWKSRTKPAVLVVVVGETARAANWGLNGYLRQTTPELAKHGVYNFSDVTSCGTNTEVSVPCLFSPFGRHEYDEDQIRQHESLLHVFQHANFNVIWRDNQSGCKGVCSSIETEQLNLEKDATLCDDEGCLDEILLKGLDQRIQATQGSLVVVLHQLGNHGPAYFKRYPSSQRHYQPTCDTVELGRCSHGQIVNSYDNAIRYTDHFLAKAIDMLAAQSSHDAALVYVSDHGESLGESGIFLHGLPRAIAPSEQTHVPMVMWLSSAFTRSFGLDTSCLRAQQHKPLTHDNLFHTLLGMLDIQTAAYEQGYDFAAQCRR